MRRFVAAFLRVALAGVGTLLAASAAAALDPEAIRALAFGESDAKIQAIGTIGASGDPDATRLLQSFLDGEVQTVGETQVLLVQGEAGTEVLTGKAVSPLPENRDDIVLNNRVRKQLATAIAALKLSAPDRATRLAAAKQLQDGADEELLPAIDRALARADRGGVSRPSSRAWIRTSPTCRQRPRSVTGAS